MKIYLTQETVYKLYAILSECEDFLSECEPHGKLHTKVSDLLNEVEREKNSFSYLQP